MLIDLQHTTRLWILSLDHEVIGKFSVPTDRSNAFGYLANPCTWPWSPNGHSHGHEWPTSTPFCSMSIDTPPPPPPHSEITAIHVQGHVCGQRSRSHLTLKIQRSKSWPRSNLMVTFEAWVQSICLLSVSWQSGHFWIWYSKFHIWPWIFKVKVMAKVKSDGDIWGLDFNQYICFSFRGNRTIFGWDIANSIFDLENSRSRSTTKIDQHQIK